MPGLLLGGIIIIGILTAIAVVKGEEEARKVELHNIQSAVMAMMADNNISAIPNPVTIATNDMGAFPDVTTPAAAKGLGSGDKDGYLLYGHDKTADGATSPTIDYVSFATTLWTYTVASDGTVIQGARKTS